MNILLKSRLTVAAAIVIGVAIGLLIPIIAHNAKKLNAQQEHVLSISDSDENEVLPDTARQEFIATETDTSSPQAKPPVLKISGKENPDVYLQSLDINVEVTGSIASTRYTMVFKNKTNRILEGELTFPLPDGRTVTHYALDINGRMREAVPVEKAKGTEVFEEIEQRRVDPGLLERVEGNNFRTRVYPIPAYGTRTVAIGYEEELTLEKSLLRYRLPMAYPDSLEKFAVKATVWNSRIRPLVPEYDGGLRFDKIGENYIASFARENYRPARSLNFALPSPEDIPSLVMQPAQGSYYFFVSVTPKSETRKKQWADNLAIIWDVSLSGSQRDLKRELEILDIIFAEKKEADVHLYFLNNKFKKIADKETSDGKYKVRDGKWDRLKKVLETAVFDGGTDFSQIKMNNITGDEILFFSDGISTLSDADFLKNTKANRPIHGVISSAKADYSAMKLITGKSKGKFININALSSEKLQNELLSETMQFLGTEHGKSVREVYPSIATPVHGNFSVAGISDINDAELTMLFGFGGKVDRRITVKLDAKSADAQVNAHKIWAQKKIAELDLNYEKNRDELTELGEQFGIVTRNTSLIVLESVDDYIRYNITPPVTETELYAEYLRRTNGRVGQKRDNAWRLGGVNESPRSPRGNMTNLPVTEANENEPRGSRVAMPANLHPSGVNSNKGGGDPRVRVTQMGVLGVVSGQVKGKSVASADIFGKGGFATDIDAVLYGAGGLKSGGDGGALKVSSPDFLKGGTLTGGRSRASIHRIVTQNIAAIRYAYKKRLREKPGMCGRITVKFAIDEFGKTIFAQMTESTIHDFELEQIVVSRVNNWTFGKIDKPGDVTEVTYPFVFTDDVCKADETIGSAVQTQTKLRAETFEQSMDMIERQARERAERQAKEKAEREARELAWERVERQARERAERARERAERQAREREERARERAELALERAEQSREMAVYRAVGKYGDTLNGAVTAAEHIRLWWNTDFTPKTSKYPTPDDNGGGRLSGTGSAKAGFFKGADYLMKMTGKTANDYQTYLSERKNYANSPTFYFDMASWFYVCGDKETAIRVLTSIADLELENAALYRLLGYRLKEFGEYALEKFVCQKVVQWRPMEPQSHRDYANALADNGEAQAALDALYGSLTKEYSANIRNRSKGVEEVTVTEINRLIAKYPNLNKSKIHKRLLINIPVDVRVVINWNMNSTDIDLHVVDPTGVTCYYRNLETKIGGRISADVTNGYGPEQFLLKKAVKGKYRVYVNYYGDRKVTDAGPATVMAEIYTKYADATERRQVVCVQMSNVSRREDGIVQIAEFEF